MTDTVNPRVRSGIMRKIKCSNTKIDVAFRRALQRCGLRYRINVASLPGKPDIVFPSSMLALLVDSCFFHGCQAHLRTPKPNQEYWYGKIHRDMLRDMKVKILLDELGWTVLRIWEHELKRALDDCADRVETAPRNRTGTNRCG